MSRRRPAEAFPFSAKSLKNGFTPVGAGKRSGAVVGPDANRGQKGGVTGFALGIDYLTVTFPMARLEECSITSTDDIGTFIFGSEAMLRVSRPTGRKLYRYDNSCLILDREGALVGRVAFGGNAGTMLVEVSGEGCRWIRRWEHVHFQLEILAARVSRCDLALDDFGGISLDLRDTARRASEGLFNGAGRPPKTRFLDDHGHGTGCTLYVGKKGHKELCIYEKGKQLKDESSPWLRIEQRFYGKHVGEEFADNPRARRGLPLDMLLHPLRYFRGAHAFLDALCARIGLQDVANKLTVVKAKVEATASACVKWLRTQCGPSLGLILRALGDQAEGFLRQNVTRESLPSRFKTLGAANQLYEMVRQELCPA
ncbi:replication initiation factor domain-containing protein [Dyella choica]|uniref:Phage replication protein n=1 Tax=Dyella choica TaxID=1927959 RepID=A0A432MAH7_9GAMM|nr:replication initiation factor domain-containing protein [Dyella choica]RUL78772.1 phage replication protein [Dyella choica]